MDKKIYSVSEINEYIKDILDGDMILGGLFIKGELSNYKVYPSGHHYFTMKDQNGAMRCVMFKGSAMKLRFKPENGMRVIAFGRITVFPRDGAYQLYVSELTPDGVGDLHVAFEQLKEKLLKEGLFDREYKKPIPRFPEKIAVITSGAGAAVRDIINIATRRNPYIQIILYPAIVQGEQAAESIVNGIHALERLGVDTMIVGRGGGSIEDLWAFNEQIVAQAVFDCQVPIISAVGHETDTTIIDYVADLRAPTPSAAAELAVYDYQQLMERIESYRDTLKLRMEKQIERKQNTLSTYKLHLKYLSPLNQIQEKRMLSMDLEGKLETGMKRKLTAKRHELALIVERMKGLSPLDKLSQGYAFVEDTQGKVIHDIAQIREKDLLQIYVKNGTILAEVKDAKQLEGEKWQRN